MGSRPPKAFNCKVRKGLAKKNATPFWLVFLRALGDPLRSLRLKALVDLSPQQVTQCLLHHRPADF